MGPGRTGVKGVIRDQHEAQTIQAAKREKEMKALRKRMERGDLGGKTFLEEERDKRVLEGLEQGDVEDDLVRRFRRDILGRPKEGPFGHLREVGRAGFVSALEGEERGVWVVIHLYESVRWFFVRVHVWRLINVCESRWTGVTRWTIRYPSSPACILKLNFLGLALLPSGSPQKDRRRSGMHHDNRSQCRVDS